MTSSYWEWDFFCQSFNTSFCFSDLKTAGHFLHLLLRADVSDPYRVLLKNDGVAEGQIQHAFQSLLLFPPLSGPSRKPMLGNCGLHKILKLASPRPWPSLIFHTRNHFWAQQHNNGSLDEKQEDSSLHFRTCGQNGLCSWICTGLGVGLYLWEWCVPLQWFGGKVSELPSLERMITLPLPWHLVGWAGRKGGFGVFYRNTVKSVLCSHPSLVSCDNCSGKLYSHRLLV